jgi:other hect domain ubiquitin protein ligase E3
VQLKHFDFYLKWVSEAFAKVSEFVAARARHMDLNKWKGPLNAFEDDQELLSGLAVVFKNDATLCLCSGIKFFSDP